MKILLQRLAQDAMATLGHFETDEHEVIGVSLEPPWRENRHDVSCVPAGTYQCHRAMHHGKYEVWELADVPARQAIHIHIGNSVKDTEGCPLIGTAYGPEHTISESKKAFTRFMDLTRDAATLELEVRDP